MIPENSIITGDCLEVMKDWPDNCVDLVLTDPPYGIGRNSLHEKNKGKWGFKEYGNTNWDTPIDKQRLHKSIKMGKNQIIWGAN